MPLVMALSGFSPLSLVIEWKCHIYSLKKNLYSTPTVIITRPGGVRRKVSTAVDKKGGRLIRRVGMITLAEAW